MKDLEKELLRFCEEFLYKLADFEELEDLHWISYGYGDGESFCYDCCTKEVDKINKELIAKGEITVDEDGDIYDDDGASVDGGWGGIEEDGCASCESCGAKLEATLTRYGVESEVDHFIRHFSDYDDSGIDNDQLIELQKIFECSGHYDFSKKYERDMIRLASMVLSILGNSMEIEARFEILDL